MFEKLNNCKYLFFINFNILLDLIFYLKFRIKNKIIKILNIIFK